MIDLNSPNHEELLAKWRDIIKATAHIFTWTSNLELSWLAEYATRCSRILEIGSYSGRSAKVMLLANPYLKLVSLDTWDDGNLTQYTVNLEEHIRAGRVSFFQGMSQNLFDHMDPYFDGSFVDGGHEEHLVIADIKGTIPLMKPGSLMSGHDFRAAEKNDVWRGVTAELGDKVKNPVESIWTYQL